MIRRVSEAVLVADEPIVRVVRADVAELRERAQSTARHRIRLRARPGPEDRLHEMIIVLGRGSFVRPHKHLDRTESFHAIEGEADVVLLDDDGAVTGVVRLGDYHSGATFLHPLLDPRPLSARGR